jgi:hypothetical protein
MGKLERLNPNHLIQPAPPRVRDAVGRILELGDEVLVITPKFPMRVAEITPTIEQPGVPPGMMRLTLVAKLTTFVPRDTGVEDMYFTRHQKEIGDGAIALAEQTQEAAEPTA